VLRGFETSCLVTDSAASATLGEGSVVVGSLAVLAGVTRGRTVFAGGAEPASASARISAAVLRLRGVFGRSGSSMREV
jgi:hypothetical protein